MQQLPPRMLQYIREFCAELRAPSAVSQQAAINNYRQFLRGNIADVISKTFPLFSQRVGNDVIHQLATHFLASHGAEEAEFHHIATEMLCFLQQRTDLLSPGQLKLAEYEWLLFYVEIDPSIVLSSATSVGNVPDDGPVRVVLNPTLQCMQLPLSVLQGDEASPEIKTYALFRNQGNEVMKKSLTPFDHQMLHLLVDNKLSCLADLQHALPAEDAGRLAEWIACNMNIDVISLQTR